MAHELLAIVSVAGRTCAGLVFLVAATQKAQAWKILFGVIANYRLLPRLLVAPVAALLPPVEMALAILLLSSQAMPWAVFGAIALLMLFAAAMAINIGRGRIHIDCGCGQSFLKQSLSWALVARNGVLAAMLLPSLAILGPGTMSAIMTGIATGLAFFLLYLLLNIISALPRVERRGHRFA